LLIFILVRQTPDSQTLMASHFKKCDPDNQIMRFIISVMFSLTFCAIVVAQGIPKADSLAIVNKKFGKGNAGSKPKEYKLTATTKWYSEAINNGILIQNSFPKGGPYTGPTKKNFNYSSLTFFTRVTNVAGAPLELTINFSADSFAIPSSPDTFVKLFLPPDTMTFDKEILYNYGVTDLVSFDKPTSFQRTINPGEECLFYVVAIFYQTRATARNQQRGGNRAELVLEGQDLFYRMPPQINSLPCGYIISKK
jgi:hypothetical protein